ncbi:MAG: NAD-dependent epimerase/dehydratase family protein [Bacteroidota bacterium]
MEINKITISILGCGWLGFPLAKRHIEKGFSVKGSTTSIEKLHVLEVDKIQPFLIDLTEEKVKGNVFDFLSNSEILIIDIPPKLRGEHKENFVQKIQNIIPFVEEAKVKKVLFVSSTSVYGEDNAIVTEETNPNPITESGKQLLEVEKILQNNSNFKTTVLRFGGLIGPNRQPIKHLSGRENIENPNAPINLIHQLDCIEIIEKIILRNIFGETFNAVAPFHPSRKEYYTQKAIELNLDLPKFKEGDEKGKIIDSSKIISILSHSFKLDLY